MAERVSSALRLRDRPAKGDEKLLEISAKRGTTFAATLPPPLPLFSSSALRLIKLASRSLRIGRLSEGRRGKGKKKKEKKRFKQGAPKWHRADKLRYRLDQAPMARVPTTSWRR